LKTPTKKNQSTVSRIRDHYSSLSPAERKLADLLLDFPGDMASYSATELADLAGVSKAATTRFFRRLGYKSFDQARRLARERPHWGSPLYLMSRKPPPQVADSGLRRQMDRELQNVAKTFEDLDIHYLESVAAKLVKAERVWLLGFRHSHFLAGYARWQMLQVRKSVHLMDAEGSTLVEQIVDVGPKDIVIAIGFRRRTQRFLETLRSLHARNNRILYLTEPEVGASINYATWVLTAEVSGAGPFDGYPAAYSLIHLLSTSMLTQSGKAGRDRFKQIEEVHDELEDF
jgi:DNA-binding MurR/RpiR family transcriptional regulator